MLEDRIEINSRHYCIETEKKEGNVIFSGIYQEKSGSKTLIARCTEKLEKKEDSFMSLRNLHQKVLAVFFNTMKNNISHKEKELQVTLEETLGFLSKKRDENKTVQFPDKSKIALDQWEQLCRQYLPEHARAAFLIDSGKLSIYSTKDYAATKEKETILAINKFFVLNRQRVDRIVGKFKVMTFSFEKKLYFFFSPLDTLSFVVLMPQGSLGIYLKELEKLNKVLFTDLSMENNWKRNMQKYEKK